MNSNPFLRGFHAIKIQPILTIFKSDNTPLFRELHKSQHSMPAAELQGAQCIFNDEFALLAGARHVPRELRQACPNWGRIDSVFYEVIAHQLEQSITVSSKSSLEAAQQLAWEINFEGGFYSRCWEINSAHLPTQAQLYLKDLAPLRLPTGLLFEVLAGSQYAAVVCMLDCIPWTDDHLSRTIGRSVARLAQDQVDYGVPSTLVEILHLASQASTRILVFDPAAPALPGLPLLQE